MKKSILSWVVLAVLFIVPGTRALAQKVDTYSSHWDTGLTPKDGEDFINKMQYEEKSNFLFYLSNNDTNLFIYLILSDKPNIQKVRKYGLTTWINPEAKHKKTYGIEFPIAVDQANANPQPHGNMQKPDQGDRTEMMNRMMEGKNRDMVLIGFSGKGDRDTVRITRDLGFFAKLDMLDKDKVLISLVVPLKKLNPSPDVNAGAMIGVGFETGYMDLNHSAIAPAAGSSTGEGNRQDGMHGGPPQGGGMDNTGGNADQQKQASLSDLANPTKLWINEVKLAKK